MVAACLVQTILACHGPSSSSTDILVSVSYSGQDSGMESIWIAAASQADCIHIYTRGAAPLVPENLKEKVVVIDKGNLDGEKTERSEGLESMGREWNGYHIIMEDAIMYAEE